MAPKKPTSIPTTLLVCIIVTVLASIALLALLAWHCFNRHRHQPRSRAPSLPPTRHSSDPPPTPPTPSLHHPELPQNTFSLPQAGPHGSFIDIPSHPRALTPAQKALLDRLKVLPINSDTTATDLPELSSTLASTAINRNFRETVERRARKGKWTRLSERECMLLASDTSTVTMQEEWRPDRSEDEKEEEEAGTDDDEEEDINTRFAPLSRSHPRVLAHLDDRSIATTPSVSPSPSAANLRLRSLTPLPLMVGRKGGEGGIRGREGGG